MRIPLPGRPPMPALVLIACLAAGSAHAETPSAEAMQRAARSFQQANAAYEKSDFAGAADLYRRTLEEGVVNSRLYYNYANSLFRQHTLGLTILYYEKARKLDPNDADIAYNLRFANAQTVDKNPVPETGVLTRILWSLHSAYSINGGLWTALGLSTFLFLAGCLALYAGPALRGVLYAAMGLALLGGAALAPSLAYKIKQQESVQYGIVLKPSLEMYSGPGDNYQVLTKVHEGTKFEIVETHGDWVSVKLLNGKGGFVRYADLGKV